MVSEECLLIVHAVLYLKKVNWSNIVTKCPLHQKRNFEFFWVSKRVDNFFMIRYLKSIYWLSSVSCTKGVLTDCLACVVHEECSLIICRWCAMKLKILTYFFLFWSMKSVYWLSSVSCTQRVLNVCLICVVLKGCSLTVLCNEILRVFSNFGNYGTWRVFTDCPCCTVPEEGKLIKYSHQMSPPHKKEFWVFSSFPHFPMFVSISPRMDSISPRVK